MGSPPRAARGEKRHPPGVEATPGSLQDPALTRCTILAEGPARGRGRRGRGAGGRPPGRSGRMEGGWVIGALAGVLGVWEVHSEGCGVERPTGTPGCLGRGRGGEGEVGV